MILSLGISADPVLRPELGSDCKYSHGMKRERGNQCKSQEATRSMSHLALASGDVIPGSGM